MLTANYNSIEYAQRMLEALDERGDTASRWPDALKEQLEQQSGNITEVGEAELTGAAWSIGSMQFRSSPRH